MRYRLKAWHLYLLIFAISGGALAYAVYYLQARVGLTPCPLCILQRMAYIAVAAVALLALLHRPKGMGRAAYGGLLFVSSLVGAGLAIRQLYVASGASVSCKVSLEERLVNGLPTAEWWPQMFQATGECGGDTWTFLGMSIPTLSLIVFAVLIVLTFWAGRLRSY